MFLLSGEHFFPQALPALRLSCDKSPSLFRGQRRKEVLEGSSKAAAKAVEALVLPFVSRPPDSRNCILGKEKCPFKATLSFRFAASPTFDNFQTELALFPRKCTLREMTTFCCRPPLVKNVFHLHFQSSSREEKGICVERRKRNAPFIFSLDSIEPLISPCPNFQTHPWTRFLFTECSRPWSRRRTSRWPLTKTGMQIFSRNEG